MKKFYAVLIALLIAVCFATVAVAQDVMIDKKVNAITFKKDKNGNEYARITVTDKATMNGITYDKSVSIMAFGDMATAVKAAGLKKGDTLKGVANKGEYKGNPSYTLLGIAN